MLKMEGYKIERTVWKNCLEKNINSEKVLILKENYRYNSFVASTNLKDFLRNSRKFQKSLKCEKTHVCKITACVFNFIKFYKILENTEKISKINFKNYFLSQKNFKKISRIAIPYPIWIRRKFNVNFCTP